MGMARLVAGSDVPELERLTEATLLEAVLKPSDQNSQSCEL